MGRIASAVVASAYVVGSIVLFDVVAHDWAGQGAFVTDSHLDWLFWVPLVASIAVAMLVARPWVLVLPLLALAGGWTVSFSLADEHVLVDLCINIAVYTVGGVLLMGIVLLYKRLRRRSSAT